MLHSVYTTIGFLCRWIEVRAIWIFEVFHSPCYCEGIDFWRRNLRPKDGEHFTCFLQWQSPSKSTWLITYIPAKHAKNKKAVPHWNVRIWNHTWNFHEKPDEISFTERHILISFFCLLTQACAWLFSCFCTSNIRKYFYPTALSSIGFGDAM